MIKQFQYESLIAQIKNDFKIDYYGDHGINHWRSVYENTQRLSAHYKIESEVFELFALLHDSKRENEAIDKQHGKRASEFVENLLHAEEIVMNDKDAKRLLYTCANHTYSDKSDPLFNDLIVQICFDSDRLDIGRVGYVVDPSYLATGYAKQLAIQSS